MIDWLRDSVFATMKLGSVDFNEGEDMTPEGQVKAKFNRKLKALGNQVYKYMPVPSGFGLPSLDWLLCVHGRFVAVEAKASAKKHPTPRQEATMAQIRAAGGLTFVIFDDESIDTAIGTIVLLIGAGVV